MKRALFSGRVVATLAIMVPLAAWTLPVSAQSLDDALSSAYQGNPQLLAQRASLRATDENLAQARAGWRPTATASALAGWGSDRVEGTPQTVYLHPDQESLTASQPIYRGGTTTAAVEVARDQIEAGRAQLVATEETVLLDTATAYFDVLRDQATVQLNVNNEQVLRRQLEATQDQFRVGEVTRTDVSQAESRLAQALASRIAAEAQLNAARATFERLVGRPPVDLAAPPPPDDRLPPTIEQAISVASTANPNIVAAKYTEGANRVAVDELTGQLLPQISLNGTIQRSHEVSLNFPDIFSKQVTANVTMPLYEAGSTYSRIRQQRQTASQALIAVDVTRRQIIEQTTTAYNNLRNARAQITAINEQIRAASIALEGTRQEAQVGSRTVLDVLNAEQELLNAQVSLVSAQHDVLVFSYQTISAIGGLTAKALSLPVQLYDYEKNYNDVSGRWWGTGILKQ